MIIMIKLEFKQIEEVVIRISASYAAKNNLDKLLLESLEQLGNMKVDSEDTARKLIDAAVLEAHEHCKTKCGPKQIELKHPESSTGPRPYINGLIYMQIMKLKIFSA